MRKIPKNYRLSPITCRELQRLKELEPDVTETELVERAITHYLCFLEPPFSADQQEDFSF